MNASKIHAYTNKLNSSYIKICSIGTKLQKQNSNKYYQYYHSFNTYIVIVQYWELGSIIISDYETGTVQSLGLMH